METISTIQEKARPEVQLSRLLYHFFDSHSATAHLTFFEYWMEKVLNNKPHKKYINPPDLLFFADKFYALFEACYQVSYGDPDALTTAFKNAIRVDQDFVTKERGLLRHYPNYLGAKALCNPLLVLQAVFKTHNLLFYKQLFQEWVAAGLSPYYTPENAKLIIPLYGHTKKLIGACWLIHERFVSKNSYRPPVYKDATLNFALSCPLLLNTEQINNPFLTVEHFFNFSGLNDYKEDLSQWFKAALSETLSYENPNDLLFIHNQFLQLIQAGFLITANKLVYHPGVDYSSAYKTCGHWLLAVQGKENPIVKFDPPGIGIKVLPTEYWGNPIRYCEETLHLNHIRKLRYGLKAWLEAALSKQSSITTLDPVYIFDQFEELQQIMEALYLLIVQAALTDLSQTNPPKFQENE
jgi:hypothetical protein